MRTHHSLVIELYLAVLFFKFLMDFPKHYRDLVVAAFFAGVAEQLMKVNNKQSIWRRILLGETDFRVTRVRDQHPNLLRVLFLKNISRMSMKKTNWKGGEILKCIFSDLQMLLSFFEDHLSSLVHVSGHAVHFIAPYGHLFRSFKEENYAEYENIFIKQKWPKELIELEGATAFQNLARTYNSESALVFILKKFVVNGTTFFKLLIPDDAAPEENLYECVSMRGRVAYIPQKFISRSKAKNPFLLVRNEPNKLSSLAFSFRPFKVSNNKIQWKEAAVEDPQVTLDARFVELLPVGVRAVFEAPADATVEGGGLLGCEVMFCFKEGWFWLRLLEHIPNEKRSPSRPFQYTATLFNDCTEANKDPNTYFVEFDLEKYRVEWEAVMGTWFKLTARTKCI
jgi:hypothetical protein